MARTLSSTLATAIPRAASTASRPSAIAPTGSVGLAAYPALNHRYRLQRKSSSRNFSRRHTKSMSPHPRQAEIPESRRVRPASLQARPAQLAFEDRSEEHTSEL